MKTEPHSSIFRFTYIAFLPIVFWLHASQPASSQTSPPQSESPTAGSAESNSQPKPAASPKAITTVDPNVTQAHLKLFVKPLTTDELIVEANAWQELLKTNVQNITKLQIRIEEISAEKSALEQNIRSSASGTATSTKDDSTAASNQAPTPPPADTQTPPPADTQTPPTADAQTPPTTTVATLTEQQTNLSIQLTDLTLVKTDISQKLEIILSSLELKGGDPTSYRKYINALNGVTLDVTNATGLWRMLTTWLFAEQGGKRWLWNLVRFAVTLLVSYFGASIIGNFVRRATTRVKGISQLLVNFLSTFAKQISMLIGFIIGLAALEIDITPLLAAVGAAGFVVAFALQGTLSNFASGMLILAYRPFDVGDVIQAAGVSGSVDSVSLFSTHVRTFDNKLMIIPNNDIWGGTITNSTASDTRRVDLVFGIGYADDIDHACKILKRTVENHPLVLPTPAPNIKVNELADSQVNLICRPWTRTEDYWSVYWDLIQTVKKEFDREGVSIPFPQHDVHVYQQATAPTAPTAPTEE